MKKLQIFVIIIQLTRLTAQGQTHYGAGSGTAGIDYSYFGVSSGNASTSAGAYNSFFGAYCGRVNTTGDGNTGIGALSFFENTEGRWNTAIGVHAMQYNTTGDYNVAIGEYSLQNNTTANDNTSLGWKALYLNTTGYENTAVGNGALINNSSGHRNVAIGSEALITDGSNNTATGMGAIDNDYGSSSGTGNSGFGYLAFNFKTGSNNTAFGSGALGNIPGVATNNSCGLGGATRSMNDFNPEDLTNSAAFGFSTRLSAFNQIRFGNSAVLSIGGQVSWSVLSDGRFKKNVKPSTIGLDFIRQLHPVSYIVDKNAYDRFLGIPDSIIAESAQARKSPQRQMGFVAQEVDAIVKKHGYIFSGVDEPQNENDPYTLRYSDFVMPLVKAVQELSALADARQKKIASLKEKISTYQSAKADELKRASGATLSQNNPNPFSISTEIKIALPETTSQASIVIYNLEGKQLRDLRVEDRGATTLKVSATDLKPGMYLYTLIADGKVVDTKRLIIR